MSQIAVDRFRAMHLNRSHSLRIWLSQQSDRWKIDPHGTFTIAVYVAFAANADAIAEVTSSSQIQIVQDSTLEIQVTNEKIGVR